jgi:hypothetical protein
VSQPQSVQIELIRGNGTRSRHDFTAERITMGRADEADISVPEAEELEPIHLLIMPRPDGVWVSAARECRTRVTIDGKPFENGVVARGTEIDIGSVTVHLLDPRIARKGGKGGELAMQIGIIAVCIAIAIPLLMKRSEPGLAMPNTPAPALFDAPESAGCPSKEPTAGATLAADGYAKMVRYPYDAQDGVAAVTLFDQARACMTAAGAGAGATERVDALRGRLATQMEDEYRVRRLQLAVVLAAEKWDDALAEIKYLTALLAHRPGPYVDSLRLMKQRVQLRIDQKKKKKSS